MIAPMIIKMLLALHGNTPVSPLSDSLQLEITYDDHKLFVEFLNVSNDTISLVWNESAPYIDFESDSIHFDINVFANNKLHRLKIIKNIPSYTNETFLLKIPPNSSIGKFVSFENMLKEQNITEYNYLYVKYRYIDSNGDVLNLVSNKLER